MNNERGQVLSASIPSSINNSVVSQLCIPPLQGLLAFCTVLWLYPSTSGIQLGDELADLALEAHQRRRP
jgi:hypothetical protein